MQRYSYHDIPTKYQYLIGITLLVPIDRLFDAIVDVDY